MALLLATAIIARPPILEVMVLVAATLAPIPTLVLLGLISIVVRMGNKVARRDEAAFLHGIAMEMRAGSNLRAAIVDAAAAHPDLELGPAVRLASVGAPVGLIARALGDALPEYGDVAEAAIRIAGATGGRVASVFESLAQVAAEDREIRREAKAATAQARISAWIVGGMPVGFLLFQVATGRIGELLESSIGVAVLALGGGLLSLGIGAVIVMLRKALP